MELSRRVVLIPILYTMVGFAWTLPSWPVYVYDGWWNERVEAWSDGEPAVSDFDELLANICDALKREQRISYRALRRRFELSDDDLEDITDELIHAKKWARDEDSRVLEWVGDTGSAVETPPSPTASAPDITPTSESEREPLSYTPPHLAEKILQSKSALEGERKNVSVLFCDLANSTPLAEKIGPENMHALLNRFFELALNEVHRYEGTINQFLGDGFMALFGAPIAHEDHSRRAALSTIGLQQRLKEVALGSPYGVDCQFRIGINSGLVVVGSIGDNLRMDYSAIGDTTNLAARLQTQAEPGEILVSETTARLVEGYIRLESLEPVEVKGKTEPIPIYKVLGTLPRRSPIVSRSERTLSQFVGRERELATLEELFTQVETGNGQVVGIVAEAGQGKSRLLYEFRKRLEDKPVTYLEGRCLSYGSSIPYHPIIDVLRYHCGITETDSPEVIVEKVGVALREVGMDATASTPYLLRLLGVQDGAESIVVLTPEAVRTRTFETLRQMSLNGAQRQPLIVEIEDQHWLDKTSEDYLASLVESLPGASILLLTTYRPGYRPPWIEKSYATQISLHGLAQQDALNIVYSSRPTALSDQIAQTIVEKAEGNPFFLEELTCAVAETGEQRPDVVVPDTVQGVLSARIDRLPETHKRLLQTASVLGREFAPALLKAMWEQPETLDPLLLELKRLEFLFERAGTDEPVYVFKHALTQDVVYGSLLTTRRQVLHEAAGQALENLYENRLEEAYDRLAYHYAKTDNAARAVKYLTLVAKRAAQAYAHAEAVTTLEKASVHAEHLPKGDRDHQMLGVAIRQAESLFFLGHHQALIDLLLRYQERLTHLEESALPGPYYIWLGQAYMFLGQRQQAMQNFESALQAAIQCGDETMMGRAYLHLGAEHMFAGRLHQAIVNSRQSVWMLETTAGSRWLDMACQILGNSCFFSGDFPGALAAAELAQRHGETTGDRRCQTKAAQTIGWTFAAQGEWEEGIAACQRALACSPDAFETAFSIGCLGYAYLEKGDATEAISILEDAVDQANQYRSRQVQSWFKDVSRRRLLLKWTNREGA